MDVHAFDENGKKLSIKGELVCTSIFPSMPIYFWNDHNHQKYQNAYFSKFEKACIMETIRISKNGSMKIYGRVMPHLILEGKLVLQKFIESLKKSIRSQIILL